ncbi:tetratricopeptide repeat protein [Candidatus Nitrosocosmicus hydrocola]|uniref:tetratricopeptide repeat protein n=1 Tax=Candidatus Nitrosocosmicus hydrocola TaxID=1826872 RepID=UPI000B30C15E|nr:tetratricopeptide repeat protein [Candidatus Nitrosocosmicus hydrocola]
MEKNYKINKIPKTSEGENNNNSINPNPVKNEDGSFDNSDNDIPISINKNSYKMLNPELQDAFGEITEILNEKIKSISLSIEHKNSIQEHIEELGLLMRSIPSNDLGSTKTAIEPPIEKLAEDPTPDISYNATAEIENKIEINPQYADAYNNKGLSLYYLGNNQEAIACYDKAIEINPEYDLAYYNKGIVLSVTGNNQEAIACYDKAIEINPQYADAYNNKGLSLYYLGNNQEAIACYDKAIESNPYFADAFFNKGMSLSALSKFPEAIASFDKTLEIDSDHVRALNGKAWIMASHYPNRLTESLDIIKRALGIDPTDIDVLYTYGFILENLGSYQESLSIYRHILKQDPLIPEVWYRCFVSKTKTSDSESSDSSFYLNQAIDLNPEYAELSRIEEQKKIPEREAHFSIPFMGI